jgi:hypothetical protein
MPLPSSKTSARRRPTAPALVLAGLLFAGCGDGGDGGKVEYSQDFEKPAGATAKAEPSASPSRSEARRKDIEDSKHEPAGKGKGSRRR